MDISTPRRGHNWKTAVFSTLLLAAASAASAGFTWTDYTGWNGGAAGSSGGTLYPFPNPYYPQTLAPLPELSGNYAAPYLFSPQTGSTYADPMFYHGQRALQRWDSIQSRTRRTGATRTVTTTRRPARPSAAAAVQAAEQKAGMAALQEVVDK